MPPRANQPAYTRDDLVQEASFLPIRKLKGAWQNILKLAEDMEKAGARPREIYDVTSGKVAAPDEETGVWRNPADQWIFELGNQGRFAPRTDAGLQADLQKNIQLGSPVTGFQNEKLGTHWDDPLLYDRVPEARDVGLNIALTDRPGILPPAGDNYYSDNPGPGWPHGTINLTSENPDPNASDPMSLRGSATHEVEHVVQNRFGLPRGGSPADPFMNTAWGQQMVPYIRQLVIDEGRKANAWTAEHMQKFGVDQTTALQRWTALHPKESQLLQLGDYLAGRKGQFQPKVAAVPPAATGMDRYLSLTGEQQAENATQRMDMTMDQRRATPAFETETAPSPLQFLAAGNYQFQPPSPDTLKRFLQKGSLGGAALAGFSSAAGADEATQRPSLAESGASKAPTWFPSFEPEAMHDTVLENQNPYDLRQTLAEYASRGMAGLGMDERLAAQKGSTVADLFEYLPFVGGAPSAQDAYYNVKEGRYGEAAADAGIAAATTLAGPLAKLGIKALKPIGRRALDWLNWEVR